LILICAAARGAAAYARAGARERAAAAADMLITLIIFSIRRYELLSRRCASARRAKISVSSDVFRFSEGYFSLFFYSFRDAEPSCQVISQSFPPGFSHIFASFFRLFG
jgi:hypothetical protein